MATEQTMKPIRCRAAVCRASGEPLVVEEIVVDPPRRHEVRIRIVCASLCHTDIAFWRADAPSAFPMILGHESYGVVESVGEAVHDLSPGDTVVPSLLAQCDTCRSCSSSRTNMCETVPFAAANLGMRRDSGGVRFRDAAVGTPVNHCLGVSGFSQYTVVDEAQVVRVDAAVPPSVACLLSCGAGTGVGAAWRLAGVEAGATVGVFGLGGVGTAVVQGAKMCGASRIIGVDTNPDKEEVGKSLGVTDFINPSRLLGETPPSVSDAIRDLTGGGVDYSFECVGVASVMTDAFNGTKQGTGTTIILGVNATNEPMLLPSLDLLYGKRVMGALLGGIKPKTDIPLLAGKCVAKELELERLVTHEVGLRDINTAFDLLLQGKSLRCIIWMDK